MSSASATRSAATDEREWLETDGLGGYVSGTVSGIRTRRYHGLLVVPRSPPAHRFMLVNGAEVAVTTPAGTFPLSSHHYAPGVIHPDGVHRLRAFDSRPWPRWTYRLEDGTEIAQELFVLPAPAPGTVIAWRLLDPAREAVLSVRPLLSGRDHHALHRENPVFRFEARVGAGRVRWDPYPGVPGVVAETNGDYRHEPEWYRGFLYDEERRRGLDFTEDLASPGSFHWHLSRGEALWILRAALDADESDFPAAPACRPAEELRAAERQRRGRFPSELHRAASAYVVRRGEGRSLVAGYPWFTDWGRDTFIALRGLCIATGRLEETGEILREWSGAVSEGLLPNRFPDGEAEPEYNSVDAGLWFIIAVQDFLDACRVRSREVPSARRQELLAAVEAILAGYAGGTRHGIHADTDGLLAAGDAGLQLTWMDARIGDRVVTPRIGKPVEVQALWLNALSFGGRSRKRWRDAFYRGLESFRTRFWFDAGGHLHDVVDCDHRPGATDSSLRPNQILAVGGLPLALLEGPPACQVVETVEKHLWTPLGLRSLAPGAAGYAGRYEGSPEQRDGAYHQGTVWPWLLGPFVDAWMRVHGDAPENRRIARERFVTPLLDHLPEAGLGHVSEIADGEPPHTPRGCPFQAWSLGELLRLTETVLDGGRD